MVKLGARGSIVTMSSANAVVAIANQVPCVVSKGGINQLTKVIAIALAPNYTMPAARNETNAIRWAWQSRRIRSVAAFGSIAVA